MSAPLCTVTPLEALRRLYDVARKVDAHESGEFDCLLQGELAVAEAALREAAAPVVPVAGQPVVPAERAGMLKAADIIGEKANDYLNEFSTTEHDTGAVVFLYGQDGCDYYNSLVELAEEIRSASPQPAASVTDVAKDADRKDADRWRMHLHLMIENGHRVREVGATIDAVDAAIAAQQGEKTT